MDEKTRKKTYQKPEVKRVTLKPEEAVLGACKASSGGPGGPGQANCSTPSACSSYSS